MKMTRTMPVRVSQFLLPKEGAGPEECEDAVGVNVGALRFALADGATEAFDAGNWARALAAGWVESEGEALSVGEFGRWAAEAGRRWRAGWEGRELPWYAEEKARAGSFAAFVGVGLEGDGRWRAVALGDACLVQSRGGNILTALPLSDPAEFGAAPVLVASRAAALEGALGRAVAASGEAAPGDVLLLLSDAAAAWFLKLSRAGDALAEEFDSLLAASENDLLAALFGRERARGRIKDDDVALVRIAFEGE